MRFPAGSKYEVLIIFIYVYVRGKVPSEARGTCKTGVTDGCVSHPPWVLGTKLRVSEGEKKAFFSAEPSLLPQDLNL